jgi:hypothetical protein
MHDYDPLSFTPPGARKVALPPGTTLTLEAFSTIWAALAAPYGRVVTTQSTALVYGAIVGGCPAMTYEALLLGIQRAILTSQFMPTVADVLWQIFERDESRLPHMPDIEPRGASDFQRDIYHRALAIREKALQSAPPDFTRPRSDFLQALEATSAQALEGATSAITQAALKGQLRRGIGGSGS